MGSSSANGDWVELGAAPQNAYNSIVHISFENSWDQKDQLMNVIIRITLPEAPDENLVEKISRAGFVSAYDEQRTRYGDHENIRKDFAEALVSEGIISPEQKKELIFEFG